MLGYCGFFEALHQIGTLIGQNKEELVETLMERQENWKRHEKQIGEALTMWSLSKEFGWTPQEIRSMDKNDLEIYKWITRGNEEGKRTK